MMSCTICAGNAKWLLLQEHILISETIIVVTVGPSKEFYLMFSPVMPVVSDLLGVPELHTVRGLFVDRPADKTL